MPKIKGTHTAMKSGMLAAEAAFGVLHEGTNMEKYWVDLQKSWIWQELYAARNYRPAFEHGLFSSLALSAFERYYFRGRLPLTLKHGKPDHEAIQRSNTNHEHDQPAHLRLKDANITETLNLPIYAGPESRYCLTRVYEYATEEDGSQKLHINAQNCLHILVPEGGGGPGYTSM